MSLSDDDEAMIWFVGANYGFKMAVTLREYCEKDEANNTNFMQSVRRSILREMGRDGTQTGTSVPSDSDDQKNVGSKPEDARNLRRQKAEDNLKY